MSSAQRYPLHWPEGWKRTSSPRRAPYKVSLDRSTRGVVKNLVLLGARKGIISTNIPLRNDGLPYANFPTIKDCGVAVYWIQPPTKGSGPGEECVIACDKWDTVAGNMRAIELAIEALRQIKRCGVSEIMDRTFKGFAALPEQAGAPNWRIELGFPLDSNPSKEQVNAEYRARAKQAARSEPDLLRLNQARQAAFTELGE